MVTEFGVQFAAGTHFFDAGCQLAGLAHWTTPLTEFNPEMAGNAIEVVFHEIMHSFFEADIVTGAFAEVPFVLIDSLLQHLLLLGNVLIEESTLFHGRNPCII